MLKQVLAGAAVFLTVVSAPAAENIFTSDSSSAVKVDGISFRLTHWNPAWSMTPQSESTLSFPGEAGSTVPGRGNVRNGVFRVRDGEYQVTEAVDLSKPGTAKLSFGLTNPAGIDAASVAVVATLPLKMFENRQILFNGKNVSFGPEFNDKNWQTWVAKSNRPTEVILPLKSGKLVITGNFSAQLQDNRRFDRTNWELRLQFTPGSGKFKKARFDAVFSSQPHVSTPIDLRSACNMGFKDEVDGDRKGGWTDQGPDNDLAMMTLGKQKLAGINFDVIDPARNDGRSCIVLRGKERPYFPDSVTVKSGGAKGRYLYLLNAVAWEPKSATRIGTVEVRYTDGKSTTLPLVSGTDTANFWMPRQIPNAAVAWRNSNYSANIGLYATRFPLSGKAIDSLTFRSAGDAVWMIVGATLSDDEITPEMEGPLVMQANPDWVPIQNAKDIVPGSVLDFSFLLDKPAGKYGFVRNVNGEFQFEKRPGKPARFFGANICFTANFMEKKFVDRMTDEFAATGYNIIRLHHYDRAVVARKNRTSTSLDPAMIDKMDYLLASCKERGIYVTLDLFIYRRLEKGEIPEFPDHEVDYVEFKALAFVNENAMKNFETFSANLMNHVNPYTKLAWKDDPAIVTISLINEDTLSATYYRYDFIRQIYDRKFEEYVKANRLTLNEDNRRQLFERFLNETYSRGYQRMSKFLRSIGVKALLTDQNYITNISATVLRDQQDFVDNHFYWGHPQFLGGNWKLPAAVETSSAAGAYAGGISGMFPSRIFGKPFTITEWDYVNPNPFNVEGSFLVGAYSALQNYGGLCRFAYAHSSDRVTRDQSAIGFFDVSNDPLRILSERAGTLFFLRGDVKSSEVCFPYLLNRNYLDIPGHPANHPQIINRLGLIGRTGTIFDAGKSPEGTRALFTSVPFQGKSRYPVINTSGGIGNLLQQLLQQKIISSANYDPATLRFTSSTGELEITRKTRTFRAVTPRSEGFVAPAQTRLAGKFAEIVNGNTFSAILVAAVDDRPLAGSDRILILHLTDVKNTGMKFTGQDMSVLQSWGTLPQLMRRGEAEITLAARPGMKLYACGFDGSRKFEVPTEPAGNGKIRFTAKNVTDQGAIVAYELVRE